MRLPAVLITFLLLVGCAQQAAQEPPPPPKPPLEFLGEWGTPGDGPGQLNNPRDIASDFAGNVYVVESDNGFVHKFDPEGRPLLSFQDPGLRGVSCVALDRGGAIYVGDLKIFRIFVFLPDGTRLRTIRPRRVAPDEVSVDEQGSIFVLGLSGSIEKLSSRGRSLVAWGKRGGAPREFAYPTALTIDSDSLVYVADMGNGRVQKFTRDGEFVGAWQIADSEPGAATDITAFGQHLFLLVLNKGAYRLQVNTPEGNLAFTHDLSGRLRDLRSAPRLTVSRPRRELLVLNPDARKILRFRINF